MSWYSVLNDRLLGAPVDAPLAVARSAAAV